MWYNVCTHINTKSLLSEIYDNHRPEVVSIKLLQHFSC